MGAPPVVAGRFHVTVSFLLPLLAVTDRGLPGVVRGVTVRAGLGDPESVSLAAVTVTEYVVPFFKPVIVHVVLPVQVLPPGVAFAVYV